MVESSLVNSCSLLDRSALDDRVSRVLHRNRGL